MLNNFSIIVALRYFLAKKNEKFVSIISAISLIGIMIGVAALIVVMSIMNGFHKELTNSIIGLNGDISIMPQGKVIENLDSNMSNLQNLPFVKRASALVQGQALAKGNIASSGVIVRGIGAEDLKFKDKILNNVISGSFDDYIGNDVAAIGMELAHIIGARVGDKVKLISPESKSTLIGSLPRAKNFKIIAVFNSGLYEYDAASILLPKSAAQSFFSLGEGFNLIEVKLHDSNDANIYIAKIQSIVGFGNRISSWQLNNQQFLSALEIERAAMFSVLSLIIIVAAFNIISSLFMLVKDKTRDIAIMRTIGASRKQIVSIFIINGMIISFIGTSLGIGLGLLIAKNIEKIRQFLESLQVLKSSNLQFIFYIIYLQ